MSEVAATFTEMNKRLTADKAKKLNTTFLFEIGGEGGGKWLADLTKTEGPWVSVANESSSANCTVSVASGDDWVKLAAGKINPTMAFMQGKVKIKGDMALALKLGSLLA